MRRLPAVATLLGMVLLVPGIPARANVTETPSAYGEVSRFALASDNLRIGGKLYMYVAGGYEGVSADGEQYSKGFATRGRCYEFKKKHFKITVCMASSRAKNVPEGAFGVDPALRDAHLSIKGADGATKLRWTGRGVPSPDAWPAADPEFGAFAYAHVYRAARPRGTILGRRLDFRGFDAWSFLDEGADALVINHARATLRRTSDGIWHLRTVKRVRI